jgi:hypothetical protein
MAAELGHACREEKQGGHGRRGKQGEKRGRLGGLISSSRGSAALILTDDDEAVASGGV